MSDDFTRRQMEEANRRQQEEWAENTRKEAEEAARGALTRGHRPSGEGGREGGSGESNSSSNDFSAKVIGYGLAIVVIAIVGYLALQFMR